MRKLKESDMRKPFLQNNGTTKKEVSGLTLIKSASTMQVKTLHFCKIPKLRNEIQGFLNLKNREHFRREILKPLIVKGFIRMTIPDNPQSSKQKYVITKKGEDLLEEIK